MRTIEENFKYIADFAGRNYDEIFAYYVFITMVGSVHLNKAKWYKLDK